MDRLCPHVGAEVINIERCSSQPPVHHGQIATEITSTGWGGGGYIWDRLLVVMGRGHSRRVRCVGLVRTDELWELSSELAKNLAPANVVIAPAAIIVMRIRTSKLECNA